MNRALLTLGLAAGLAPPAAAQWLGEPAWNSPTGGGLAIDADYARPNSNYGSGSTWGARVSAGIGTMTVTVGAANWTPEGGASVTSYGFNAAFRLVGETLLPTPSSGIWANLQLGVAHTGDVEPLVATSATAVTGAVGLGVQLSAPGVTVEPYFSPGIRYRSSGGASNTEFGYAIGADVGFGLFGVHLAYDNENVNGGGNVSVFGVGAHVTP
jgi:hypothetical protein